MQYPTKLLPALAAVLSIVTIATAQIATETSCITASSATTCVLGWQFLTSSDTVNAYIHNNNCTLLSATTSLPIGKTTILTYPDNGLYSSFILTNPSVCTAGPAFAFEDISYTASEACVCGETADSYACSCDFLCPTPGS